MEFEVYILWIQRGNARFRVTLIYISAKPIFFIQGTRDVRVIVPFFYAFKILIMSNQICRTNKSKKKKNRILALHGSNVPYVEGFIM